MRTRQDAAKDVIVHETADGREQSSEVDFDNSCIRVVADKGKAAPTTVIVQVPVRAVRKTGGARRGDIEAGVSSA